MCFSVNLSWPNCKDTQRDNSLCGKPSSSCSLERIDFAFTYCNTSYQQHMCSDHKCERWPEDVRQTMAKGRNRLRPVATRYVFEREKRLANGRKRSQPVLYDFLSKWKIQKYLATYSPPTLHLLIDVLLS